MENKFVLSPSVVKLICAVLITFPFTHGTNDCPEVHNCVCQKARARIKCWNTMEVPEVPSYIQRVELSDNAITELKHSDFSHNNLTELFLNNNKISSIDKNTFEDLSELIHLNLSNNRLRRLDKSVFKYNKKLKQLHLADNHDLFFSLYELPTSIEHLNLMNTNSMMTYNVMQRFLHLRSYHGNFCLRGNCSHWIQMNAAFYSDEDTGVMIQTTTEKSQTVAEEQPQTAETKCKTGWQTISCVSCTGTVLTAAVIFLFWKLYNYYRLRQGTGYENVQQQQ